jgi:hypothetical protein
MVDDRESKGSTLGNVPTGTIHDEIRVNRKLEFMESEP